MCPFAHMGHVFPWRATPHAVDETTPQDGLGAGEGRSMSTPVLARPAAHRGVGVLQAGLRTRRVDARCIQMRIAFPRASWGCAAVALDPPNSAYRCGGSAGLANESSRTGFPIIPGQHRPGHLKSRRTLRCLRLRVKGALRRDGGGIL